MHVDMQAEDRADDGPTSYSARGTSMVAAGLVDQRTTPDDVEQLQVQTSWRMRPAGSQGIAQRFGREEHHPWEHVSR